MGASTTLVARYYLYQVTLSMGFYVPVQAVYLLDKGFGVGFVGLTWAAFSFSLLLAELPTGYLGDRLGRRRTLLLGSACRVVGMFGYAVADAAVTFLVLKVFFATGWALRSGTTDAYLYELLARELDEERFTTIRGRGEAALLATSALTALAGGVLYTVDPALPFLASGALAALGLPILATFPDVAPDDAAPFTARRAAGALARQLGRPGVRWLVAYSLLLLLAFDLTRTFEQPALRAVGASAAELGALYAVFKLVSAAGGIAVGPLRERFGARTLLAALAPLVGVLYAGLLAWPVALLPVAVLYRPARTVLLPVRNQYLNDRLADVGRATVLSGASMLLSLAGGVGRLAASELAPAAGPVDVVGGAGVALALAAGGLWLATGPVRSRQNAPAGRAAADD